MTFLYLVTYCVYEGKKTPKIYSLPCYFRNDPPGIVELDYLKNRIEEDKYEGKGQVFILSLVKVTDDMNMIADNEFGMENEI